MTAYLGPTGQAALLLMAAMETGADARRLAIDMVRPADIVVLAPPPRAPVDLMPPEPRFKRPGVAKTYQAGGSARERERRLARLAKQKS